MMAWISMIGIVAVALIYGVVEKFQKKGMISKPLSKILEIFLTILVLGLFAWNFMNQSVWSKSSGHIQTQEEKCQGYWRC